MKLAGLAFSVFCVSQLAERHASAQVAEFTNKASWSSNVGLYTTIGFTEFPNNTLITDQYSAQGVVFTDGADYIHFGPNLFPNDSWGLRGAVDSITVEFASPISWVGVEFPGSIAFELYIENQLLYESSDFLNSGPGHFAGLVSSNVFDKARIFDPLGGVSIDDLHFGPPIPAPGALVVLGVGMLLNPRRERHIMDDLATVV